MILIGVSVFLPLHIVKPKKFIVMSQRKAQSTTEHKVVSRCRQCIWSHIFFTVDAAVPMLLCRYYGHSRNVSVNEDNCLAFNLQSLPF